MLRLTIGSGSLLLIFALSNALEVDAAETALEETGSIVLAGARIVTQSDLGTIVGDILIEDGKVAAIGGDFSILDGARRIDVTGMVITPGLIDARSSLWLTSSANREGANDGGLNVLDGVDPLAEDWREVARQGVTAVYVQPSRSGNLGGSGAVLRVAPATSVEDLTIEAAAAAQAAIGTTSSSQTSRNRYTQYDRVKKALEAAKKYGEQLDAYAEYEKKKKKESDAKSKKKPGASEKETNKTGESKKKTAGDEEKTGSSKETGKPAEDKKDDEKKGDEKKDGEKKDDAEKDDEKKDAAKSSSSSKPPTKPTPDPAKDFLLRVIKREIPIRIEAHREDDLKHALKLADDLKIRVVIEGASNPRSMLEVLVDRRTPLVIGPAFESGTTPTYRRGRPDELLSQLAKSEGRWALATFAEQPRGSRALRAHAAAAIAAGVDPENALRAVTSAAAAMLGVEDKLGAIAKDRVADLVVFAGHPLDPSSPVRMVMSQGKIVYESEVEPPAQIAERGMNDTLAGPLPESYAVTTRRMLWPNGKWGPGTIVVNRGKIAAITELVNTAGGARVIDLGDTPVTSGLVIGTRI